MEKEIDRLSHATVHSRTTHTPSTSPPSTTLRRACGLLAGLVLIWGLPIYQLSSHRSVPPPLEDWAKPRRSPRFRDFPLPNDPFQFLPCTAKTVPPALDDYQPQKTWASRFDPDPHKWSWGGKKIILNDGAKLKEDNGGEAGDDGDDKFKGRGIYLCGYLDLPMDYTNESDARIVRLAVTKFQVSGAPLETGDENRGRKSARTIVINPGGPGGSGTSYTWGSAESITQRLSDSQFDVLGWDPRGVNISLPSVSCFPHDANRDRWSVLAGQYREDGSDPRTHLQITDAMNEAIFNACWETHGDFARFVGTSFVARDLERIREALGEDELTALLVSYGTGIGQTYANMFPNSVGRMILDGTEYVRDHRLLGGFGFTALDNSTNAWFDGFLGECLKAGPDYCALARPQDNETAPIQLADLKERVEEKIRSLRLRPMPAYTVADGPSLVTYSRLVDGIYGALYNSKVWPTVARALYRLGQDNATLAALLLDSRSWLYEPRASTECSETPILPHSGELSSLVICADSYDAPRPDGGLDWWADLWADMIDKAWIAGNSRFFNVFPCRHFLTHWPHPAEVYRGDLNNTLKNPVLLIAETYDPATPLRNGRRLLAEMGRNARLIVHHGYGHSSRDKSNCTEDASKDYILTGKIPDEQETDCFANEKPYLYGVKKPNATEKAPATGSPGGENPNKENDHDSEELKAWREHMELLALFNPSLVS